jgi:hypothetical protein
MTRLTVIPPSGQSIESTPPPSTSNSRVQMPHVHGGQHKPVLGYAVTRSSRSVLCRARTARLVLAGRAGVWGIRAQGVNVGTRHDSRFPASSAAAAGCLLACVSILLCKAVLYLASPGRSLGRSCITAPAGGRLAAFIDTACTARLSPRARVCVRE